jgi:hypothetical protein
VEARKAEPVWKARQENARERMIGEVGSDPQQQRSHPDPERGEVTGGADPRTQKDRRAPIGSGGEHDRVGFQRLFRLSEADAGGPRSVQDNPVHHRFGPHREFGRSRAGLR